MPKIFALRNLAVSAQIPPAHALVCKHDSADDQLTLAAADICTDAIVGGLRVAVDASRLALLKVTADMRHWGLGLGTH